MSSRSGQDGRQRAPVVVEFGLCYCCWQLSHWQHDRVTLLQKPFRVKLRQGRAIGGSPRSWAQDEKREMVLPINPLKCHFITEERGAKEQFWVRSRQHQEWTIQIQVCNTENATGFPVGEKAPKKTQHKLQTINLVFKFSVIYSWEKLLCSADGLFWHTPYLCSSLGPAKPGEGFFLLLPGLRPKQPWWAWGDEQESWGIQALPKLGPSWRQRLRKGSHLCCQCRGRPQSKKAFLGFRDPIFTVWPCRLVKSTWIFWHIPALTFTPNLPIFYMESDDFSFCLERYGFFQLMYLAERFPSSGKLSWQPENSDQWEPIFFPLAFDHGNHSVKAAPFSPLGEAGFTAQPSAPDRCRWSLKGGCS